MMNIKLLRVLVITLFMTVGSKAFAADNIISVAKNGGDFNSIKKALASIYDNSKTNRYLISIGPGVFSITEQINMKPYVSITGSGVGVTQLVSRIREVGSKRAMFYGGNAQETRITNLSVDMYANFTYLSDRILVCDNRCPVLQDVDFLLRSNLPDAVLWGVDIDSTAAHFKDIRVHVSGRKNSIGINMHEGNIILERAEVISHIAMSLIDTNADLKDTTLRASFGSGVAIRTAPSDEPDFSDVAISNSHLRVLGGGTLIEIDPLSLYTIHINNSILETRLDTTAAITALNVTCAFTGDGIGGIYDRNCTIID